MGIGVFRSDSNGNSLKLENIKILFQFLLMLICSLTIGGVLIKSLPETFYQSLIVRVSAHFETVFINCDGIYDHIKTILLYALSDILSVAIIFVVSFSAFNYVLSDFLLVYNGIRTGASVCFLYMFISNPVFVYNIGLLRYIVFLFFKAVILILIFDYAYRAAVYSRKLKITTPSGRPNIKIKVFFPFVMYTLTYIGSLIIINGAYCWLIYFLK